MKADRKAVADQAAAPDSVVAASYDVKLNGRFAFMDFAYLPGDHHVVDQTVYDEMKAAGVIADVKQLS